MNCPLYWCPTIGTWYDNIYWDSYCCSFIGGCYIYLALCQGGYVAKNIMCEKNYFHSELNTTGIINLIGDVL